ncbi:hypothetical protein GQ53DRAFT_743606 [Thozetella sp. PMI_491]|nr:hypothetical protein GQ53DRAFT_743606 [Thozetella sp. PMI_491]
MTGITLRIAKEVEGVRKKKTQRLGLELGRVKQKASLKTCFERSAPSPDLSFWHDPSCATENAWVVSRG